MARVDPKQEHPWLVARLDDLLLDVRRFQATAERQEWDAVAEMLGQAASVLINATTLLEGIEP